MAMTFIQLGYLIFGVHSLLLIIVGTSLNLICFYVFTKKVPNRTNATIIVFSYLAIIELLIPFTWNLNYVARELIFKYRKSFSVKNLEETSLFVCKLISYGAYFLLQCAAWLKSLASFTRCVSLHHDWPLRGYMSKPSVIHYMSGILILLIGLINLPVFILNGKYIASIDKNNQTQQHTACYRHVIFKSWEIVHLLLYNFVPFTSMILCNLSIIHHVHASRRRTRKSRICSTSFTNQSFGRNISNRASMSNSGSRLTKTLILITVFFIVFTSPSAIFYIFFGKRVKRHRNLITMGLSNLATTSHISSFIVYWLTSTDFRHAVIALFNCQSCNNKSTTDDNRRDKSTCVELPATIAQMSYAETQVQNAICQQ